MRGVRQRRSQIIHTKILASSFMVKFANTYSIGSLTNPWGQAAFNTVCYLLPCYILAIIYMHHQQPAAGTNQPTPSTAKDAVMVV